METEKTVLCDGRRYQVVCGGGRPELKGSLRIRPGDVVGSHRRDDRWVGVGTGRDEREGSPVQRELQLANHSINRRVDLPIETH